MTAALLHDLNEVVGVPAYVAYGTLLGAVRSGRVIGHDTDADVSYLSRFSHPADMATESFRIQRELRRLGWTIDRGRSAKLVVRKRKRHIDIFVSYFRGDRFSLDQWVEGPLRRDQILPLSTVTLEGHSLPAPADPAALLALNYGPGWRTPDPSFHYDGSLPHLARARGWFGGHTAYKIPWNRYWSLAPRPSYGASSPFARWVIARADPAAPAAGRRLRDRFGHHRLCAARHRRRRIRLRRERADARPARQRPRSLPPPRFVRLSFADGRVILAEGTTARRTSRPQDSDRPTGPRHAARRRLRQLLAVPSARDQAVAVRRTSSSEPNRATQSRLTGPPVAAARRHRGRATEDLPDSAGSSPSTRPRGRVTSPGSRRPPTGSPSTSAKQGACGSLRMVQRKNVAADSREE